MRNNIAERLSSAVRTTAAADSMRHRSRNTTDRLYPPDVDPKGVRVGEHRPKNIAAAHTAATRAHAYAVTGRKGFPLREAPHDHRPGVATRQSTTSTYQLILPIFDCDDMTARWVGVQSSRNKHPDGRGGASLALLGAMGGIAFIFGLGKPT